MNGKSSSVLTWLRAPYSFAYLVTNELELLADFDSGPRRVGAMFFVAVYLLLQMLFLAITARYFFGASLGGKAMPPFWILALVACAVAWLASSASISRGERLSKEFGSKWPTLFAIYLIPGIGIGTTLYWSLYIPFALVHVAIFWFLTVSYRRYVTMPTSSRSK